MNDKFVLRLLKAGDKSITIKHGNTMIINVPAIFMIFFDIFDAAIEFDNIISILENLVKTESVTFFVKTLPLIITKQYESYFHIFIHNLDSIITNFGSNQILLLCENIILYEYLQYDKELFLDMCDIIAKRASIFNVLETNCIFLEKINRILFKIDHSRIYKIEDEYDQFENAIKLIRSGLLDAKTQDELTNHCHKYFEKNKNHKLYNDYQNLFIKN